MTILSTAKQAMPALVTRPSEIYEDPGLQISHPEVLDTITLILSERYFWGKRRYTNYVSTKDEQDGQENGEEDEHEDELEDKLEDGQEDE